MASWKWDKAGRNKCPMCDRRLNDKGICPVHGLNKQIYSVDDIARAKVNKEKKGER